MVSPEGAVLCDQLACQRAQSMQTVQSEHGCPPVDSVSLARDGYDATRRRRFICRASLLLLEFVEFEGIVRENRFGFGVPR